MQMWVVVAMYMVPTDDPLVAAIRAETPRLEQNLARDNVYAARLAALKYGFEPEELLAQAWVESRFNPYDLSRIQCEEDVCERKRGVWKKPSKPPGARPTYYCGPMQVGGSISWKRCKTLMADLVLNYDEGAAHLREWERLSARDRRCRKHAIGTRERRTCAYRGYGGGWKMLHGNNDSYPRRIYWMKKKLERHLGSPVAQRTDQWKTNT